MNSPISATSRPRVRRTTAAALTTGTLSAAGLLATVALDPAAAEELYVLLAVFLLASMAGGVAPVLAGLERGYREVVRAVAQQRMRGRDNDVLEAVMLAEIRAIHRELRANNDRWERRARGDARWAGYAEAIDDRAGKPDDDDGGGSVVPFRRP